MAAAVQRCLHSAHFSPPWSGLAVCTSIQTIGSCGHDTLSQCTSGAPSIHSPHSLSSGECSVCVFFEFRVRVGVKVRRSMGHFILIACYQPRILDCIPTPTPTSGPHPHCTRLLVAFIANPNHDPNPNPNPNPNPRINPYRTS